jgi:SAM-dependent methyltransferase
MSSMPSTTGSRPAVDDRVYEELAAVEGSHWWFQARRRILRDVLRRVSPATVGGPIVDIGCGTGEMLDMLREFGPVLGLDGSPIAIRHCRERFGDDVDVRLGRIPEDLPAGAALVTAFDVVEHLEDDQGALAAIRGSLAPGGHFVCTVPAFSFLWSGHDEAHHHFRRYTHRTLRRRLEAAGFTVERLSYFNTFLFPPVAAIRVAQRLRPGPQRGSDASLPSPWANRLLLRLFASERWLLRFTRLPVGISLLAVCSVPTSELRAAA